MIVAADEDVEPALRDHWEDVCAAFHDTDAHHLYVKPDGILAALERDAPRAAVLDQRLASRSRSARRRPTSPRARCARPSPSSRSSCARATRPSSPGRSAAPPSAPPTTSAALKADFDGRRRRPRLRRGRRCATASSRPQLKLAVDPRAPADPPPQGGRRGRRGTGRGRGLLRSFTDLRTGDIVVHEDHGIARFAGFDTKTVAGVTRDYLNLEYAGTDKVFLPVDQLAKISRYVGADGAHPPLSKLGGTRWDTIKARARRAAQELAGELLNLYAERKRRRGHAFEPDSRLAARVRGALPVPRDARPARGDRVRQGATWSPSARWTG